MLCQHGRLECWECAKNAVSTSASGGTLDELTQLRARIAELEQLAKEMVEAIANLCLAVDPKQCGEMAGKAIYRYRKVCGGD